MNIHHKEMDCTLVWDPIAEVLHLVDPMHISVVATHDMGQTEFVTEIQDLTGALQVQGITARRSCRSCKGNPAREESHVQELV